MNILVITLGTRDVQLKLPVLSSGFELLVGDKKGRSVPMHIKHQATGQQVQVKPNTSTFSDSFLLVEPRFGGDVLRNENWWSLIEFPIIDKALNYLLTEDENIDYFFIVYTDQQDDVSDYYKSQDTLHFSTLLSRYLETKYPQAKVDEYPVQKEAINIDFQYRNFYEEEHSQNLILIPKQQISKVWLLPQGGIDQINQALTLRLIEVFQEKLIQLQVFEDPQKQTERNNFPSRFLSNLLITQAYELAIRYEYTSAVNILRGKLDEKHLGFQLLQFAAATLAGNKVEMKSISHSSNIQNIEVVKYLEGFQKSEPLNFQLQMLFISTYVKYYNNEPNDMLWRMYALGELLMKKTLCSLVPCKIDNIGDAKAKSFEEVLLLNTKWKDFLNISKGNVNLPKPNGTILSQSLKFFAGRGSNSQKRTAQNILELPAAFEPIRVKRNELLHNGKAVTIKALDKSVKDIGGLKSILQKFHAMCFVNDEPFPIALNNLPLIEPLHKLLLAEFKKPF